MTGDKANHHGISERIDSLDWHQISRELNDQGWSILPNILSDDECNEVASLYSEDSAFRSHVVMARHEFGRGEYKYFLYPLPKLIAWAST